MNTSRLVGSPISPLFIANRLVTVQSSLIRTIGDPANPPQRHSIMRGKYGVWGIDFGHMQL